MISEDITCRSEYINDPDGFEYGLGVKWRATADNDETHYFVYKSGLISLEPFYE